LLNGSIRVKGLLFAGRHGVLPEEKTLPQTFEVDVEVIRDLTLPAETDRIEDTVNYSHITALVREVVEGEPCNLIERLAGNIMNRVATIVPDGEIIVRVRKPNAPLGVQFDTVEVELRQTVTT